jgi:hypothetical protein
MEAGGLMYARGTRNHINFALENLVRRDNLQEQGKIILKGILKMV